MYGRVFYQQVGNFTRYVHIKQNKKIIVDERIFFIYFTLGTFLLLYTYPYIRCNNTEI